MCQISTLVRTRQSTQSEPTFVVEVPPSRYRLGLVHITSGRLTMAYAVALMAFEGMRFLTTGGELADVDCATDEHFECSCDDSQAHRDSDAPWYERECKHALCARAILAYLGR